VKHSRFESWIRCVPVCFPAAIEQIDLDAAANGLVVIDPNCSVTKIRSCFAVPSAELNDLDFISGGGDKMLAEISGKPACLQLQFRWNSRRREQRALMNASCIAHLRVALCQRAHARIMKRRGANVTFGFGVRGHLRVRRWTIRRGEP